MARLVTLQPRMQQAPKRLLASTNVSERRITGRALQARRLRIWTKDPHCAICRCLVEYPYGFELDHVVRLEHGGPDDESNCQVLCAGDEGCHAMKTREEGFQPYRAG